MSGLTPQSSAVLGMGPSRRTTAERNSGSLLRGGSRIVVLIADNHATKLAVRMAKALLRPRDELQLLTMVASESARAPAEATAAQYVLPPDAPNTCACVVLPLPEGQRMSDAIAEHVAAVGAALLVAGSHNLGIRGDRQNPLPASGSFCLRLVKAVNACPLLVVKVNSRGPYLNSSNAGMGLKVMVDVQSNTRHLLGWLMDHLDPERDGIYLAASKAVDQGTGQVGERANRMLTVFVIQTAVNGFYSVQRAFKTGAATALPQAVEGDGIDLLAVAAPPCRVVPEGILDLLRSARTSVLVYRPGAVPRPSMDVVE